MPSERAFLRLVMNFNEEAISAKRRQQQLGESGSTLWALAGAVAGIDENGQVTAFFLTAGDDGEVKGIARKKSERRCAHRASQSITL